MEPPESAWCYASNLGVSVRAGATDDLWGQQTALAWLPDRNATVRIQTSDLLPVSEVPPLSSERISYVAAAARVAGALERDALVASVDCDPRRDG